MERYVKMITPAIRDQPKLPEGVRTCRSAQIDVLPPKVYSSGGVPTQECGGTWQDHRRVRILCYDEHGVGKPLMPCLADRS